ncbi:MAG: hypothetical protein ACQES5_00925 [Thermodesulfobacteriota bacterium]
MHSFVLYCLSSFLLVILAPGLVQGNTPEKSDASPEKCYALSIYGGALTDDDAQQTITGQADFVDSHLVVAAAEWTFWRESENRFSLGLESNVAKHFGNQEHWEFNLPVLTTSWNKFPWQDTVEQSLGFGIGPSLATKLPKTEEELDGSTECLMLYWHLETTFSLPESPWSLLFRLHHRSPAYGTFGEDGGSNALTTGLRYRF